MSEPLEKLSEESLGNFLVRCREARGLTREELSEETHVSKVYLEWIETGDWKKFSVEAYLRSYLNSISVRLALDPKKVLEWYACEVGSVRKEKEQPSNNEDTLGSFQEKKKSNTKPIIICLVLLVILAALLYVMNLTKTEVLAPVEEMPPPEEPLVEDTALTEVLIPDGAEQIPLDSVLLEDSLAAAKVREVVDSVAKEKDLPASATLFLSSTSGEKESVKEPKEKTTPEGIKTSIEFMASGNEETWIGIKGEAEGENFLKQGNLSLAGARLAYTGSDTLYVIVGNPTAIVSLNVNGKKVTMPSGTTGRSLRFRVFGEEIHRGF